MKVVVLVNSVPDTAATPEIAANGCTVESAGLEFVLDPYAEIAVEEAVRLKERLGAQVTAVAIGGDTARKALRCAFAMGVETGVLVLLPPDLAPTARGLALALVPALRELAADLILVGKQMVDCDEAQVAERVAEHLGAVHAAAVSHLAVEGDGLVVHRELEGGHLVLQLPLPAVVTTEKGLNVPRYPSLPQILKAKNRPLTEVAAAVPAAELTPGWQVECLAKAHTERDRRLFQDDLSAGVRILADLLHQD